LLTAAKPFSYGKISRHPQPLPFRFFRLIYLKPVPVKPPHNHLITSTSPHHHLISKVTHDLKPTSPSPQDQLTTITPPQNHLTTTSKLHHQDLKITS
jgi:hypothetical protein